MNNKPDINYDSRITEAINKVIKEQIDETYTEYKNKCLSRLDTEIELKRNDVVKRILDDLEISLQSNEPYDLNPTIVIKVNKIIKLENR